MESTSSPVHSTCQIALIGMAGRFPGADSLDAFLLNLRAGRDSISHFTDQQVREIHPQESPGQSIRFVRARGVLDGIEYFDAPFFGFSPNEAAQTDPQQRIWFETAWHALEHAGYCGDRYPGRIGVFAGSFLNNYHLYNLMHSRADIEKFVRCQNSKSYGDIIANSSAYLPSRTSYLFNLTGPSVNVQTACSTSLVAIIMACQSLLNYESDMCLSGGICIAVPQQDGYYHQAGATFSRDGRCRPFDSSSSGTVFSSGVGAVVLKRLEDAVNDNDTIYSVITGYGLNNDGASKMSYLAPSVSGQAVAICTALQMAGIDPSELSYVEAHGTATPIGDPIEIAALTKAFTQSRLNTAQPLPKQFCAIGSVKGNIGHCDAAAGIAGVLKTTLALQHKQLFPTVHFIRPNPAINFENSPFYVAADLNDWQNKSGVTRKAGVSSFGIGGTNAHIIMEEAPQQTATPTAKDWHLLCFSAKTESALETMKLRFLTYLKNGTDVSVADMAYTLFYGRKQCKFRSVLLCQNTADAKRHLIEHIPPYGASGTAKLENANIVFVFGEQEMAMDTTTVKNLYDTIPLFRTTIDSAADFLKPLFGIDIRWVLYQDHFENGNVSAAIHESSIAQPLSVAAAYALAQVLMHWGAKPNMLLGYGIGEWCAAAVAGIFSLTDVLAAVASRDAAIAGVTFNAPKIPLISNSTGLTLSSEQATDPQYWAGRHGMGDCGADTLTAITSCKPAIFVSIGSRAVSIDSSAMKRPDPDLYAVLTAIHYGSAQLPPAAWIMQTIAEIWLLGGMVNFKAYYSGERRKRVALPLYPFERRRYWIDPPADGHYLSQTLGSTGETPLSGSSADKAVDERLAGDAGLAVVAEDVRAIVSRLCGTPVQEIIMSRTFFELGFESLLLIQIADSLEKKFGIPIQFRQLDADYPTIEKISAFIHEKIAPEPQHPERTVISNGRSEKRPENDMTGNLVMVKPTGTWAPLIFAHGGKASKYLLEFLPQQQPLWNFVSLGSDGERIAYKTVEEMASTYVRQLREREYKKPCILAGHSFGGLIAYEMASLLLQEHVPVKMLFMIDTHHPQYYYAPLKPKTFSQGLETYLIKYPNRMIRSICRLCASGITAMYHARARAVPSWLRSYYVVNVFNYKCSKKYVPKPLSCAVTFFEAQDYRNLPSSKGWRPLITGSFDVQSIVGDHLSIIHNQEQFRTIAQTMANVLASLHP